MLKNLILIAILFSVLNLQGQLGFCKGNSGDPIFLENFGTGFADSPVPSGSTKYKFTRNRPQDGFYKVSSNTRWFDWFSTKDHTPDDKNGRSLIVNASNEPGEFFRIPVSGLCENTTYEFSSWLINLFPSYVKCGAYANAKPINVTFEIWDSTETLLLKSGSTGNIVGSKKPNWQQYGLVFQTKPKQNAVILKMRNNSIGGCGNDLAIDDIMFRTCGDAVIVEDLQKKTGNVITDGTKIPFSTRLTAKLDFSVFSTHFFQWQKSKNGVDWNNISGEKKKTYLVKEIEETSYYRVLVAEDAINLLNSSCNSYSQVYKLNILALKKPKKLKKKPKIRKKRVKYIIGPKAIINVETLNLEELTKPENSLLKLKLLV